MRLLKRVFTTFAFMVTGFVGLAVIYIVYNLGPFFNPPPPDSATMSRYVAAVSDPSADPFRFVADQFDNHSVVLLGELHKREQDLVFLRSLIGYLYKKKQIRLIGWEFGSAADQRDADSVVNAEAFDRRKAIGILRRANFDWCYEEYLDIFEEIWLINCQAPGKEDRIRFLQMNTPYNPRRLFSPVDSIRTRERRVNFDNSFPAIVEKEVLDKKQKALIYCGLHHSLTHFHTPKFLFLKDQGRGGQYLYDKYGGRIAQIALLSPFPSRWALFAGDLELGAVYPFQGTFNRLYDSLRRPFAVAADNPVFADVRDFDSFYEFDSWQGVPLSSFCDGVIMTTSFDSVRTVRIIPDWVVGEEELNEVKAVLPEKDAGPIHTINDFYRYLDTQKNLDRIKWMHQWARKPDFR